MYYEKVIYLKFTLKKAHKTIFFIANKGVPLRFAFMKYILPLREFFLYALYSYSFLQTEVQLL